MIRDATSLFSLFIYSPPKIMEFCSSTEKFSNIQTQAIKNIHSYNGEIRKKSHVQFEMSLFMILQQSLSYIILL